LQTLIAPPLILRARRAAGARSLIFVAFVDRVFRFIVTLLGTLERAS
jgi:hypothetical protein